MDSIVVLYVPPLVTDPEAVADAVRRAADRAPVPVVAVFAMPEAPGPVRGLPCFRFPEDAARALGRAARYGAWRAAPRGTVPVLEVDDAAAAAIIAHALRRGPGWLAPQEAAALLDCYGIAQPRRELVTTAAAAAAVARRWATPIALKGVADGLVHRSDAGAVAVGLSGARTIAHAAEAMTARMEAVGHQRTGFLVQAMADPGVELLVGAVADPTFGPVVAVAAGGVATELLGTPRCGSRRSPTAMRTTCCASCGPSRCWTATAAPRARTSRRSSRRCCALSALMDAHHEIAELECNPLIVSPAGTVAVDVRARVEVAAVHAPEPSLRPAA